jgi:hypothetical protein
MKSCVGYSITLTAHVARLSEERRGEPRSLAVQELWFARADEVIEEYCDFRV